MLVMILRVPQGEDGAVIMEAPGGYAFHVYDRSTGRDGIELMSHCGYILVMLSLLC